MILQSVARPNLNMPAQKSGTPQVPAGTFGEPGSSILTPRYYSMIKAGRVFTMTAFGQSPVGLSPYSGGSNGVGLFVLYNPLGSGVDLSLMSVRIGVR